MENFLYHLKDIKTISMKTPKITALLIALVLITSMIPLPLTFSQPATVGPAADKITAVRVPIEQVPDAIKTRAIDMYLYSLRPAQAEQLKNVPGAVLIQAPAGLIDIILNPAPVAVEQLQGNLTAKEAATKLGVPLNAIVGIRVEKNETTGKTYTVVELGAKPGVGVNPFAFKDIRLAMNYIADRATVVASILKGFAVPMYTFLSQYDPDYAVIADIIAKYEFNYDPALADQIVTRVMTSIGAVKSGGKWLYDGKPVTVKFIIRQEDERKDIGLMFSAELKRLGFNVEELLMQFADAINTVYGTDPASFEWHLYTEGWGKGGIDKYDSGTISQFGAPWVGYMPGWSESTFWNYRNDTIDDLTLRIYQSKFKNKAERDELYRKATEMIIQESVRIWLVTRLDTWVVSNYVKGITMDVGAGLRGIWNLREAYIEGKKELKVGHLWVWTAQSAWNIWGGFSDVYSVDFERATYDPFVWSHPFNGLPIPFRTPYVVTTAGPDGKLDVPTTAIIWDAKNDKWVNVLAGTKATSKVVFDLSKVIGTKFHNGITISMADVVGAWAYTFELTYDPVRSTLESRLASNNKAWADTIKGLEFDATNKRVTVYVDYWHFDENYIASWASLSVVNPVEIHQATFELALDKRNETKYVLYQRKGYEYFSLVYPSHVAKVKETLQAYLNNEKAFNVVNKYCNGMLTLDEWNNRIKADLTWINTYGNAWISDGPFMLTKLDKDAQVLELTAFRDPTYPFKPGDWYFGSPVPATIKGITLKSPIANKLVPGSDTSIIVDVAGLKPLHVKYLIQDASGNIITFAEAQKVSDYSFSVNLPSSFTAELAPGAKYTLILIAYSDLVATPDIKKETIETATTAEILNLQKATFEAALQSATAKISSLEAALQSATAKISSLESKISQQDEKLSSLATQLSSMQTMLYASFIMALLALLLAVLLLLRKPKPSQQK
jgi:peptide/nickel transport system substrate-binding protein